MLNARCFPSQYPQPIADRGTDAILGGRFQTTTSPHTQKTAPTHFSALDHVVLGSLFSAHFSRLAFLGSLFSARFSRLAFLGSLFSARFSRLAFFGSPFSARLFRLAFLS